MQVIVNALVFLAELIIRPNTSDDITTKMLAMSRTTALVSSSRCRRCIFGDSNIAPMDAVDKHPKMIAAIQTWFINAPSDNVATGAMQL